MKGMLFYVWGIYDYHTNIMPTTWATDWPSHKVLVGSQRGLVLVLRERGLVLSQRGGLSQLGEGACLSRRGCLLGVGKLACRESEGACLKSERVLFRSFRANALDSFSRGF